MNAIDLIRWAMQLTDRGTARIVADLRDKPMTGSTAGAAGGDGNHALWTLGHLCVIEGGIPHILLGEKNPVEHWWPLFGTGTQPKPDAAAYPSFDELLRTYHELRAKNLKLLDQIGEAGLDRPPRHVPRGFEDLMITCGHTLLLIALHNMVHYGQLADARRVAGLPPLM
jgi:hypothetical protein